MSDTVKTVGVDEQLDAGMSEMCYKLFGNSERRREPERVGSERWIGGYKVCGELTGERMHDEARVAVGKLTGDRGIFFLVAADRSHRGQAARDRVRARRDGLSERQMRKGRHLGEWAKDGSLKR